MNAVIEINRAFSTSSPLCAPGLAAGSIQIPANDCGNKAISGPGRRPEPWGNDAIEVRGAVEQTCGAPCVCLKAWGETVGFSLAALVVLGLGTLGGWAVTLVFSSLIQAQSLAVQNSFLFNR